MPRGKRSFSEIDGQLNISEFLPDVTLPVVQSYALINSKQSLKLNSAKLIRSSIMQLERGDSGFKPYIITVKEIAELLNTSVSNVYRDIESIVDDIIGNPVQTKVVDGKKEKWFKIPWVSRCEYNSDVGLLIRLNDDLAPLLLSMQEIINQYAYKEIADMRSVYSIRIYELIKSRTDEDIPDGETVSVLLSVEEIREACNLEGLYQEFSNLKLRVIDPAVTEINKYTSYALEYRCLKVSRKVAALEFNLRKK